MATKRRVRPEGPRPVQDGQLAPGLIPKPQGPSHHFGAALKFAVAYPPHTDLQQHGTHTMLVAQLLEYRQRLLPQRQRSVGITPSMAGFSCMPQIECGPPPVADLAKDGFAFGMAGVGQVATPPPHFATTPPFHPVGFTPP